MILYIINNIVSYIQLFYMKRTMTIKNDIYFCIFSKASSIARCVYDRVSKSF